MAANIKGITIEIGADATGLETALNGMNKDINSTQKQLREVNKLLQMDPGNTELIAQKQRLLADSVSKTGEKLKLLKEQAALANEKLASGEWSQDQYDGIQNALAKATDEYKRATQAAEEFNQASSKFNTTAQSIADGAAKVAEKTKAISAAAGVAAAGLIGLGFQAAAAADDLMTLSQQTGMSTDTLQAMQQYADLLDVDFNDATSAVTRLKSSLSSSQEVFAQIGVEIKDQKGGYRDINDIFFDTLKGLSQIENETERDTVAMKIFGKSANELAGYIDDGGAALQRFYAQGKADGSIISEEQIQKAVELNNKLDETKQRIKAAFGNVGMKMAEALLPVMEGIANAADKLATAMDKIPAPILAVVTVILLLIAAIAPVAMVINQVAGAITVLAPLFEAIGAVITGTLIPAITAAVEAAVAAVSAVIAAVAPFAAIIAAIALVIAAIVLWIQNWDQIKEAAQVACEEVQYAVEDLKTGLQNKWNTITQTTKAAWNKIVDSIGTVMDRMPATISGKIKYLIQIMQQGWQAIIQAAKDAGKRLMEGLIDSISSKFSSLTSWINSIKEKFDSLGSSASSATSAASSGGRSFASYNSMTASPYMSDMAIMNSYSNDNARVISAIDELASLMSNQQTNVTVTLQGDARGVFKLVRQENNRLIKSTGFHALA